MKRKLKRLLKKIGAPQYFTLTEFINFVQTHLAKELVFVPWSLPAEITASCVQSEKTVYIFYAEDLAPVHRLLAQLHEIVHLIDDHKTENLPSDSDELTIIETILDANSAYDADVDKIAMRSLSSLEHESDIDELATLLLSRIIPEREGPNKSLADIKVD